MQSIKLCDVQNLQDGHDNKNFFPENSMEDKAHIEDNYSTS